MFIQESLLKSIKTITSVRIVYEVRCISFSMQRCQSFPQLLNILCLTECVTETLQLKGPANKLKGLHNDAANCYKIHSGMRSVMK